MRVLVKMVDALGIEQRGASFDAMNGVALTQQELGQIGSVLAGDTGDQCTLRQFASPALNGLYESISTTAAARYCHRIAISRQPKRKRPRFGSRRRVVAGGLRGLTPSPSIP